MSPLHNADDQALLILFIDSRANVPPGGGGVVWPPSLRIKAVVGRQQTVTSPIASAAECRHLLIDERLVLISGNPTNDDLYLTVVGGLTDSVIGSASLELTQLLNQEGRALRDHTLTLRTKEHSREGGPTLQLRKQDMIRNFKLSRYCWVSH